MCAEVGRDGKVTVQRRRPHLVLEVRQVRRLPAHQGQQLLAQPVPPPWQGAFVWEACQLRYNSPSSSLYRCSIGGPSQHSQWSKLLSPASTTSPPPLPSPCFSEATWIDGVSAPAAPRAMPLCAAVVPLICGGERLEGGEARWKVCIVEIDRGVDSKTDAVNHRSVSLLFRKRGGWEEGEVRSKSGSFVPSSMIGTGAVTWKSQDRKRHRGGIVYRGGVAEPTRRHRSGVAETIPSARRLSCNGESCCWNGVVIRSEGRVGNTRAGWGMFCDGGAGAIARSSKMIEEATHGGRIDRGLSGWY